MSVAGPIPIPPGDGFHPPAVSNGLFVAPKQTQDPGELQERVKHEACSIAGKSVPASHDTGADVDVENIAEGGSKALIVIGHPAVDTSAVLSGSGSSNSSCPADGHTADGDAHNVSRYRPATSPQAMQPPLDVHTHKIHRSRDDDLPPLPIEATSPAYPTQSTSGIFRRITTKLRVHTSNHHEASPTPLISSPSALPGGSQRNKSRNRSRTRKDSASAPQPPASRRKPTLRIPAMPAPSGAHHNSFTSPEQRHAALVARGLVPASNRLFKDAQGFTIPLSEQEKELDRRFAIVMHDGKAEEERESEAKRIREAWVAKNRANQDEDQQVKQSDALASGSGEERGVRTGKRSSAVKEHQDTDQAFLASGVGEENSGAHGIAQPLPTADQLGSSAERSRVSQDSSVLGTRPSRRQESAPVAARRSSEISERVSRWLHSSLARRSASSDRAGASGYASLDDDAAQGRRRNSDVSHRPSGSRSQSSDGPSPAPHPRPSTDKPPPSAFHLKGKRDKPAPIVVTVSPSSRPGSSSSAAAAASTSGPTISVSLPLPLSESARPSLETALSDSEHGHDPCALRPGMTRGRASTVSQPPSSSSHGLSSTPESGVSLDPRNRLPALSPTRTTGSSTVSESVLPATPTTLSHVCEPQNASRTATGRPRRPAGYSAELRIQTDLGTRVAAGVDDRGAAVLVESPAQGSEGDDADSDEGRQPYVDAEVERKMAKEAEKMRELMAAAAAGATPRPRPQKASSQDAEKRKSMTLGLLKKKDSSMEPPPFRNPRSASSMQNLRRNITGTLASLRSGRPKSSVESSASSSSRSIPPPLPSKLTSPTSPPPSFPSAPPTSFPASLRRKASQDPSQPTSPRRSTVGVGLRPRQALSPTMHNRGCILIATGKIEDDESRRLSEMAFLDY